MSGPREKALLMGKHRSLVGVLTLPRNGEEPTEGWCAVILNAGIIHRVGANRLHVEIARSLAEIGITSVRFDLSGVGDSPMRPGNHTLQECVSRDVDEVFDVLSASHGFRHFVLVGLCSGAVNGFRIARTDPRVIGAVMIDLPAYRTFGYVWRHALRRFKDVLTSPGRWQQMKEWGTRLTGGLVHDGDGRLPPAAYLAFPPAPPQEDAKEGFAELVEKRVEMLVVFTARWHYNYLNQFRDAFPGIDFGDLLQLEFFPKSDHTFTPLLERRKLVEKIRDWSVSRLLANADRPD